MPGELLLGCALKRETDFLRQFLGSEHPFVTTGLGIRKSSRFLEHHFQQHRPRLLVFTGTAGQLDVQLGMGQAVLPEAWCLAGGSAVPCDARVVSIARDRGWAIQKLGLTVRTPVVRSRKRAELFQDYGACICDMESAAVLQAARDSGVPAVAIKVVADTAETGLTGFWRYFDANMERLARQLQSLLPEL